MDAAAWAYLLYIMVLGVMVWRAVKVDEVKTLYKIGDKVCRKNGSYVFPGKVIGIGTTSLGRVLYMVEHSLESGMVHIFRENDLKPR